MGNVYNKNGTVKKYSVSRFGYLHVNFIVDGKQKGASIHRLVAKQFIPNDNPLKDQVNHIDGDKTNNKVENLEWVTRMENVRHAIEVLHKNGGGHNKRQVMARLKQDDIFGLVFPSEQAAAEYFGNPKARNTIWKALKGLSKTAYGYFWYYFS